MTKFKDQLTVDTDGDGIADATDGIINDDDRHIIGNTLPNDIVEALRDFRSEMPSFTTEPDYEFYIPDSMIETMACPVSEDTMHMLSQDYSLDLNSTTCVGMQKQDNGMSCYSSSSDSDDE